MLNRKNYAEMRAEAQKLANDMARQYPALAKRGQCDWGIQQIAYSGEYTIYHLPNPENRYGFETRVDVVLPEINRF